jgi:hypothetical protein
MTKGTVCPEFLIQQFDRVLTIVTRKYLTVWSHMMDHQKAERVTYQNSIRDFRSFSQTETQKLSSSKLLFGSEQNSAVTSIVKIL